MYVCGWRRFSGPGGIKSGINVSLDHSGFRQLQYKIVIESASRTHYAGGTQAHNKGEEGGGGRGGGRGHVRGVREERVVRGLGHGEQPRAGMVLVEAPDIDLQRKRPHTGGEVEQPRGGGPDPGLHDTTQCWTHAINCLYVIKYVVFPPLHLALIQP